jgi:hypothetical protein
MQNITIEGAQTAMKDVAALIANRLANERGLDPSGAGLFIYDHNRRDIRNTGVRRTPCIIINVTNSFIVSKR